MIPEQNTFWLSEKTESVIYVIDRYYEGTMGETRISHLRIADLKTLKTLHCKVEDISEAVADGRLRQIG